MNNTMVVEMRNDRSWPEMVMAEIEITDLHTEDAMGIPELGASYCGSSCSACCSCCCP